MIYSKSLKKYYLQNWYMFLIGAIALIFVDIYQLEIPRQVGILVDGLSDGIIDRDGLVTIIGLIIGYAVIMVIGRFIWRITIFGASRRFDYGLRNDMFQHCEKLSTSYYNEHKTGGLMAYFTNDLDAVRMAVGPGLVIFVDATFLGILTLYRMMQINVNLALLTALPLGIITLISYFMGKRMRARFKEAQEAFEKMSDFVTENLSGINVVKAFVKEKIEIIEFLKRNQETKDKNVLYVVLNTILQISTRTIIGAIVIIIIGVGALLVSNGFLSGGELMYFYSLFGALIWPMMAIARIVSLRSRGNASLQRIDQILNEEVEIFDDEDVQHVKNIGGSIEFKNLTFTFADAQEPVLKDVSFKIEQGETVGILGRTGSGKTTIVDLLLRIYNIEDGQLFIDGYDIMELPIAKVRDAVGYVPQDGFLFSDTITNNISLYYGRREEADHDVLTAAQLSDVHKNIVEFSDGYDTVIGERGVTLSGGQRQRISIARALIKNPPIVILDDSVSAVDTKTEETILNNLNTIREGKTTIIIAHRISTIKNANKIIVVDDGRVLDIGSHDELLERCAFYKDMVERQKLEDEIEVK
jgi:ATP-binding cassette subfamily B protein